MPNNQKKVSRSQFDKWKQYRSNVGTDSVFGLDERIVNGYNMDIVMFDAAVRAS